jgi:hypothetical protein
MVIVAVARKVWRDYCPFVWEGASSLHAVLSRNGIRTGGRPAWKRMLSHIGECNVVASHGWQKANDLKSFANSPNIYSRGRF